MEANWKPIDTAPKNGGPVWVRGNNNGKPEHGHHHTWAYWDGEHWIDAAGGETLTFLVEWMPGTFLMS